MSQDMIIGPPAQRARPIYPYYPGNQDPNAYSRALPLASVGLRLEARWHHAPAMLLGSRAALT